MRSSPRPRLRASAGLSYQLSWAQVIPSMLPPAQSSAQQRLPSCDLRHRGLRGRSRLDVESMTSPRSPPCCGARMNAVTRMILLRHAEPLMSDGTPAVQWTLTERGRKDARALGSSLVNGSTTATVWTSPERRASETASLALPSATIHVREQLSEVRASVVHHGR